MGGFNIDTKVQYSLDTSLTSNLIKVAVTATLTFNVLRNYSKLLVHLNFVFEQ